MANAYIKAARALRELEPGRPLRGTAKSILVALADRANSRGQCWPGDKLIAADVGCTVRTVVRLMPVLESAGLLKRDHRANPQGGRRSDLITLLFSIEKTESQKDIPSDNPATPPPESQKDISSEPKGHPVGATTLNPQEPSEDNPSLRSGNGAAKSARSATQGDPLSGRDVRNLRLATEPADAGVRFARWWPGRRNRGGDLSGEVGMLVGMLNRGRITLDQLGDACEALDGYARERWDRHDYRPNLTVRAFLDEVEHGDPARRWRTATCLRSNVS